MFEQLRWWLHLDRDQFQPLDIVHRIVRDLLRCEAISVHGTRVFAFDHIDVLLAPATDLERAAFDKVLVADGELLRALRDALNAEGLSYDRSLRVNVSLVDELPPDAGEKPYFWRGSRESRPAKQEPVPGPPAQYELAVTRGSACPLQLPLRGHRIVFLGRGRDVLDTRGALLRGNHVAFEDDDTEENKTVSRVHARLELSDGENAWSIIDECSRCGTVIARGPTRCELGSASKRFLLEPGDRILLGRAELVFRATDQVPRSFESARAAERA